MFSVSGFLSRPECKKRHCQIRVLEFNVGGKLLKLFYLRLVNNEFVNNALDFKSVGLGEWDLL